MWDEWVEQEGLAKFKKELAAMEFTKEGEGGSTREFGGASASAGGGAKVGGRKHKGDDANTHANGVACGAQVRCLLFPADRCRGAPCTSHACCSTFSTSWCLASLKCGPCSYARSPWASAGAQSSRQVEDCVTDVRGQVRVELPAALKQVLLDDWERVEGATLVPLPRRPSIATLLQRYVDSCRTSRDVVEPEEEVCLSGPVDETHHQLGFWCTCHICAHHAVYHGARHMH